MQRVKMAWSWSGSATDHIFVVEMTLLLMLLVPLHILTLASVQTPVAQQLNFWVLKTGVEKEQNKANLSFRNAYFLLGDSPRMLCQYATNANFCAERSETNLTVEPNGGSEHQNKTLIEQRMVILEKTKCNLTVEFQNVTTDFEGSYICKDTLNTGQLRSRGFEIGEAPVAPRNLTVMYAPLSNITLLLNPVKTGHDLNAPKTQWRITATWKDGTSLCSREASDRFCNKDLTADGMCPACVIELKDYYSGYGQYTGIGSITYNIVFKYTVRNQFGSVSAKSPLDVDLNDKVKPGPLSHVEVRGEATTPSSLALTVHSPANIDQTHYNLMNTTKFYVAYFVTLPLMREQSLLQNAGTHFYKVYGFVRNLQDEEEALRNSLAQSNFSEVAQLLQWNSTAEHCDCSPTSQQVTIRDLPFSGFHYRVSLNTKARYWGSLFSLNLAQTKTKETAPLEGPGLEESFAYCLPPSLQMCVICVIYFKEIPLTKRGGVVINHNLTLTLTNNVSDELSDNCKNWDGVTLKVGGENNTFLVPDLAVGGVYHVSLQAFTGAGSSPFTNSTLHVMSSPPVFAPSDIMLEMSGVSYDLIWKRGNTSSDSSMKYYGHYCYTIPLQLQESTSVGANQSMEAPLPLNCVTNMVTKAMPENGTSSLIFDQISSYKDLTPAFFISATGPQGISSGLLSVDCFFTRGRYPKAVNSFTVQPSLDDPTSVMVKFQLPCGRVLGSRDGPPDFYEVGVVPYGSDCETHCSELMQGHEGVLQKTVVSSLKDQVVYTERNLKPQTKYCAGVNVAGRDAYFPEGSWQCAAVTTGRIGELSNEWLKPFLVPFCLLVVIFVISFFIRLLYRNWKSLDKKFKSTLNMCAPEYQLIKSSSSSLGSQVKGIDNFMFRGDSGFLSSRNSSVRIEMPEDGPVDSVAARQNDEESMDNSMSNSSDEITDDEERNDKDHDSENDNHTNNENTGCISSRYFGQTTQNKFMGDPNCGMSEDASLVTSPRYPPLASPSLGHSVPRYSVMQDVSQPSVEEGSASREQAGNIQNFGESDRNNDFNEEGEEDEEVQLIQAGMSSVAGPAQGGNVEAWNFCTMTTPPVQSSILPLLSSVSSVPSSVPPTVPSVDDPNSELDIDSILSAAGEAVGNPDSELDIDSILSAEGEAVGNPDSELDIDSILSAAGEAVGNPDSELDIDSILSAGGEAVGNPDSELDIDSILSAGGEAVGNPDSELDIDSILSAGGEAVGNPDSELDIDSILSAAGEAVGNPYSGLHIDSILSAAGEASSAELQTVPVSVPFVPDPQDQFNSLDTQVKSDGFPDSELYPAPVAVNPHTKSASYTPSVLSEISEPCISSVDPIRHKVLSSSERYNIDGDQAMEELSTGESQLSSSGALLQALKGGLNVLDNHAVLQTNPHPIQESAKAETTTQTSRYEALNMTTETSDPAKPQAVNGTDKPPLLQHTEKPAKLLTTSAHHQEPNSEVSHQPKTSQQTGTQDPYNVDNILEAVEGCPWKLSALTPSFICSNAKSLQQQQSMSDRDSLYMVSGQESGFDTDLERGFSTESEQDGTDLTHLSPTEGSSTESGLKRDIWNESSTESGLASPTASHNDHIVSDSPASVGRKGIHFMNCKDSDQEVLLNLYVVNR